MNRPTVSIVVPFLGTVAELTALEEMLRAIETRSGDELIVADNRPSAESRPGDPALIDASAVRTPAHARNAGARGATGDWLLFIDADTTAPATLIADYFHTEPGADTAVLAGWVRDVASRPTLTARHGIARSRLSQATTLEGATRPYAQTVNCAIRRVAFEQLGGFQDGARAGEDADLCFRLQDRGWRIEERRGAVVEHHSRETPLGLARQLLRHGSGAAWVERRHPGSMPRQPPAQLIRRIGHHGRQAIGAAARGDREAAAFAALDLLGACCFELGRLLPNRP